MAETKLFPLADILTLVTGVFLSHTRGLGGVQHILDFMLDDSIFTHEIPKAADVVTPILLEQHPKLLLIKNFLDSAEGQKLITPDTHEQWMSQWESELGDVLPVTALKNPPHREKSPLETLEDMRQGNNRNVIVVTTR